MLHNTITFVLVAKTLLSSESYAIKPDVEGEEEDKTDTSDVTQRLLNAFSVSIILGLTWVFGFLAVEEARMVFQLLFCICNSFQGVLIFILFCYAQKDVRRLLMNRCCGRPSSKPKHKKPKKAVDTAGNPLPAREMTSMSGSTRVTGESYSDDEETLVTKIDDATLPMTMLECSEVDNKKDDPIAESNNTSGEVVKNVSKALNIDETDTSLQSETDNSAQPIIKP